MKNWRHWRHWKLFSMSDKREKLYLVKAMPEYCRAKKYRVVRVPSEWQFIYYPIQGSLVYIVILCNFDFKINGLWLQFAKTLVGKPNMGKHLTSAEKCRRNFYEWRCIALFKQVYQIKLWIKKRWTSASSSRAHHLIIRAKR